MISPSSNYRVNKSDIENNDSKKNVKIKRGYDIASYKTYFKVLDDLYLKDHPDWVRVDAEYAPVGIKTFKDTLNMTIVDSNIDNDNSNVPLLLTNRTLEKNSNEIFIRRFANHHQHQQQQEEASPPTTPHVANEPTTLVEDQQSEYNISNNSKPLRIINSHSIIRNAISGFNIMTNKFLLAKTIASTKYVVPSYFINHSKIVDSIKLPADPISQQSDKKELWFLKHPLLNKAEGIDLFFSVDEALQSCSPDTRYLLQKEIVPMLIHNAFKFDVRVNVIITFDPKETRVYLHRHGIVRSTGAPYHTGSTDKQAQFTNFCFQQKLNPEHKNIFPLLEIDTDGTLFETIHKAVAELFDIFLPKLNHLCHHGFTVLGLDFIFDEDKNPFILEINYSPSMFQSCENESVKSICQNLVLQIPKLALEPLLDGTDPIISPKDIISLKHFKNPKYRNETTVPKDDDSEDFNLFDD
eukprot:gene5991-7464_t